MAVVVRKTQKGVSIWLALTWRGKRVWERLATRDQREAKREHERRMKEIKAGTYLPVSERARTNVTVGQHLGRWLDNRTTRNAANEVRNARRYLVTREWFMQLLLTEVAVSHVKRLVKELRELRSEKTGQVIGAGSVRNLYSTMRTAMSDAVDHGLVPGNPFRTRGLVDYDVRNEKSPYTPDEVRALCADERIPQAQRVWNTIAFLTGARCGEVCGLTWECWDRAPRPLGCLKIRSQYNGQLLKSERSAGKKKPRRVPVHPILAELLDAWWSSGFELTYCRKPTPDDFIVPFVRGDRLENLGRATAYVRWVAGCKAAGVTSRTVHATRHTFISFCIRGGATKELVEKITHNAKRDIVDTYTHTAWTPLCRAVHNFGVDADVDSFDGSPVFALSGRLNLDRATNATSRDYAELGGIDEPEHLAIPPQNGRAAAKRDAGQRLPSLHGAELDAYAFADALSASPLPGGSR